LAVWLEIAEAAAVPLAPNGQFGRADVFQAEPFEELGHSRREPGLIGRRTIVLLFRSLLLHGTRNGTDGSLVDCLDLAMAGMRFCSARLGSSSQAEIAFIHQVVAERGT